MERKSKSKQKNQIKVEGESKQIIDNIKCSACRFEIKNAASLVCETCKKVMHINCFNPDYLSNGRPFICDLCCFKKKKSKDGKEGKDTKCIVCLQYGAQEMLKNIQTPNGPQLVHTECALLSPFVKIHSYSKLEFTKKEGDKPSLFNCCGKTCFGPVIQCVECKVINKGHFRCKIVELGQPYNIYMISKWLDKCETYDFLLNYICRENKFGLKNLLNVSKWSEGQLFLCQLHEQNYVWCPCNKKQDTKFADYICDSCGRSYHQTCSGLPPDSEEDFICSGCKQKDVFKKQLKPHQLICQVSNIQRSNKWNQSIMRFLNAFPLKYSETLEKKIVEHLKQIQNYFIKRQIIRMLQTENNNEKSNKRILGLLLYSIYGQKWKQMQSKILKKQQENQKILNQIMNSKKIKFQKQIHQKIKNILDFFRVKDNKRREFDQFRQQLKNFIKKWKNNSQTKIHRSSCEQLASSLKQLQIKFMLAFQNSEQKKKFLTQFNKLFGHQIFGLIIHSKVSHQAIIIILRKYSVLKFYSNQNQSIGQNLYNSIFYCDSINLETEDKNIFYKCLQIIRIQVSKLNVVYISNKKQQMLKTNMNILRQRKFNATVFRQIQNEALRDGLCTIGTEELFANVELNLIQFNILKRKILKLSNQKDENITEQNFKDIVKIQNFLNKRKSMLKQFERQCIQNYLAKLQFLSSMLKKGEPIIMSFYNFQQNAYQSQMLNAAKQNKNVVYSKLFKIFENWDVKIISQQFIINQFYNKCALKRLKFDGIQIYQKMQTFFHVVMERVQQILDDQIDSSYLRKFAAIFKYLNIESQYTLLMQEYQKVRKWIQIFPQEESYINVANLIEKVDKIQTFIKIIDTKIASAEQFSNVNLSVQVSKLCLLRQWLRLTQKIALLSKSKPTINGIQSLKNLLDKTNYPQNNLYKKVNELQNESKILNKQVSKFLEKTKIPDKYRFYQQIKFMASKMTLEEGNSIRNMFEKSNLDVCVQIQQLQTQIKQFETIPANIGAYAQKKTLVQLNPIRRKMIDSCFRPEKIQQYQKFLRRIYVLKCLNFEPPITKDQYFQLLTIGGVSALELSKNTNDLLRAYKTLQKAEAEVLSSFRKINYSNLIPFSQSKYKELKQDLKFDPTELSKLQKARVHTLRLRQQFQHLQSSPRKFEIQKYKQLQHELMTSIFNNKDIIIKIHGIKSEFYELLRRVQQSIPYHLPTVQFINPKQNIFRREKGLLQLCYKLKIKHASLQKFQNDCRNYRRAEQIRGEMTIDSYKSYCDTCYKISDHGCKMLQFLESRAAEFMQMAKSMSNSKELHMHLYQVLIHEGLQLKRLESPQKDKIFEVVIQIYSKIKEVTQQNLQEEDEYNEDGDEDQSSIIENDSNLDDEDEDDEMDEEDEIDFDQNDEDQDQSSSRQSPHGQNGKGPNGNQIILDDDSD